MGERPSAVLCPLTTLETADNEGEDKVRITDDR
jgi:hypothetical protein